MFNGLWSSKDKILRYHRKVLGSNPFFIIYLKKNLEWNYETFKKKTWISTKWIIKKEQSLCQMIKKGNVLLKRTILL